ncbi:MAG TPA: nitroreductase family protein [Bacteroidota bacterium]|nr:nitroreductase family protein [Bacteroidota bacterium]
METATNNRIEHNISLHETLRNRRSPKVFIGRQVENEKLLSLFEAARWSPSSRNEQPWRFIIGVRERGEAYQRLFDCLTEANKAWAGQAPVLVAAVAKMFFDRDGQNNRTALLDVGGAIANLTVQAVAMGLQVHQMAGFDKHKLKKVCEIPDGYEPAVMLAIGYPDEAQLLAFYQRNRHPMPGFVFEGRWGIKPDFIKGGEAYASLYD